MEPRVVSTVHRENDDPIEQMRVRGTDTGGAVSNIATAAWHPDTLHEAVGEPPTEAGDAADAWWAEFDAITARDDGPQPLDTRYTHNITCAALHNHVAECIDITTPTTTDADRVDLAIGTGSNVTPAVDDTQLVSQAGLFEVSGYDLDSREVQLRAVLSTEQGNDTNISEIGIVGPSGDLWNHATFAPTVEKTSSIALTVEILLSLRDASEVSG